MSYYLQEWEEGLDTSEKFTIPDIPDSGSDSARSAPAGRLPLHEFLWHKVQAEYKNSEYAIADLRAEFDKTIKKLLDSGKLIKKDGEIHLNK